MDIFISVAERFANYLLHAALRQLGYLLHYNHNIRTLGKQAEKLTETRERVEEKIDNAEGNGEIIKTDVRKWVAGVDNILAEAEEFLDDEVEANMRCLKGWCINFCSLYRFSKKALKMAKEISQILEDGKFESVSYPAPPPEITSSSERVSDPLESRQIDHEAKNGDHNGEGDREQTRDLT